VQSEAKHLTVSLLQNLPLKRYSPGPLATLCLTHLSDLWQLTWRNRIIARLPADFKPSYHHTAVVSSDGRRQGGNNDTKWYRRHHPKVLTEQVRHRGGGRDDLPPRVARIHAQPGDLGDQ